MKRQDDSETAQNAGYQIRKRNYERSENGKTIDSLIERIYLFGSK